ncbi:MAG TPA: CHAP domain-containing protein [Anaeromyxobacter sp.]|nr:CHAP domain-containing protein [Anaeromyxobacter sp.]
MRQPGALALLLFGAACAGAQRPGPWGPRSPDDLSARLVSRAESALGHQGPFIVGEEHFPADCSGYAAAVYQAEGVPLRRLMARAAPGETSGVAAAYQAARAYGVVFGGGGEWPRPGDLVFFRDTYDRSRNGRLEQPFTHLGIVERVEDGTVTFLHRGGKAVVRGILTPGRPDLLRDPSGRELNTILRDKRVRHSGAPSLAGQLFEGYGRIDPERIPRELAGD